MTRRETMVLGSERLPAGTEVSFPSMGYRNQWELHTLAKVLVCLAAGETGRAADLLAQRNKAVELSLQDGDCSRTTHLELLPPSRRHLTSQEEETLVAKELHDEMRVKRYLQEGGTSSQGPGKGRGRGRQRSENGAGTGNATRRRIRRRRTGSGVAASNGDQQTLDELSGNECLGRTSFVPV